MEVLRLNRRKVEREEDDFSLVLEFQLHGGERTEKQEREVEESRRCQREFFKHNHDFTKIIITRPTSLRNCKRCHNCNCEVVDNQSVIGCLECKIYLHKDCATKGMQLNIRHIYHPFHRLTLKSYRSDEGHTRCNACYTKVYAGKFMFDCKSCNYHLCIQCSLRYPTIKDTDHHHLLTFFHDSSHNLVGEKCVVCTGRCLRDDLIVRCVNCNFNIHLHCYPLLPRTIKHQCHVDSLTLISDPDLVESDKGYDEFYCDACDKIRNRDHAVYCCAGCLFVAHIRCCFQLPLQESDLPAATTAMLEQSYNQDDHYFGHIIGNKAKEIERMKKVRSKEERTNPDAIQLVEYYLSDITGDDEVLAREFFAKLKTDEINRENEDKAQELVNLNEKIREGITKETKIVESTKANLIIFNEELQKVEAQSAKLLRPRLKRSIEAKEIEATKN